MGDGLGTGGPGGPGGPGGLMDAIIGGIRGGGTGPGLGGGVGPGSGPGNGFEVEDANSGGIGDGFGTGGPGGPGGPGCGLVTAAVVPTYEGVVA